MSKNKQKKKSLKIVLLGLTIMLVTFSFVNVAKAFPVYTGDITYPNLNWTGINNFYDYPFPSPVQHVETILIGEFYAYVGGTINDNGDLYELKVHVGVACYVPYFHVGSITCQIIHPNGSIIEQHIVGLPTNTGFFWDFDWPGNTPTDDLSGYTIKVLYYYSVNLLVGWPFHWPPVPECQAFVNQAIIFQFA
ncbi:MAG: hypothetical protein EAX96_09930 [Candidatus Lokiarchaeota archaeon]|nr:hypothetical protein [Candidatus Lokiarchaeota archaeon]